MSAEAWLEGPLEGVDPYLMPIAQALVQVERDLRRLDGLALKVLWARPGGAASVAFHLGHVAGVLDRLTTYARGETLGEQQMKALRTEGEPGEPPADAEGLVREARAAVSARSPRSARRRARPSSSRGASAAGSSRAMSSASSTTRPSTPCGTRARPSRRRRSPEGHDRGHRGPGAPV